MSDMHIDSEALGHLLDLDQARPAAGAREADEQRRIELGRPEAGDGATSEARGAACLEADDRWWLEFASPATARHWRSASARPRRTTEARP
jgi:hypothetical protein